MAKGIEYLVGVRFQSSGNLFGAMKQLGLSFLAADEASKLLKNRFVDMTATGVAMFAALADGAQAYQNNLVKLENTMASTLTAHKQMASIYGGKVGSALGPSTLTGVYANMSQQLYGSSAASNPRLMREAASTTTSLNYMFGGKGAALQNALFNAGIGYQRNALGITNSTQAGFGAEGIVQNIVRMLPHAINQGAFITGVTKMLGSPYTSHAGEPINKLISLAAFLSGGGATAVSGITQFAKLREGGASGIATIMGMMGQFGLHVGITKSMLFAAGQSALSVRGAQTLPSLIQKHILPVLTDMAEAHLGLKQGPIGSLTASQQERVRALRNMYAERAFKSVPWLAADVEAFSRSTAAQRARAMSPTNMAAITAREKTLPSYWIGRITSGLEKLGESIGGSSPIVTALRDLSNGITSFNSYISGHKSVAVAAGGSFFGAAAGFSGAGIVALISRFVGAKGLFGKLGIVFRGLSFVVATFLEALGAFNIGYFVGTLLRGVPWIKKFGDYLGDIMIWMAKASSPMKHFLNAFVDFVQTITFQKDKFPQALTQFGKGAGGAWDGLKNFLGFGSATMVGTYKNKSYMFGESQINPHTGDVIANYSPAHGAEMHIHVHLPHGVDAHSAKGLKDIAKAIADAVKSNTQGMGHQTISHHTLAHS